MNSPYRIPLKQHSTGINILKSRFLTTVTHTTTVEQAREFIASLKSELPGANHYVYAFRIGHGNSVIEGMSDDGEPTGTAGPPTLSVVRGSDLGDITLVTLRYFGGTKLGKGGLVRAYTESAQEALATLETEFKTEKQIIKINMPYHLYEIVKKLVSEYKGNIKDENFMENVTLTIELLAQDIDGFNYKLQENTSGQLELNIVT
jgi:uncharacterized YigZ family protein